MSKSKEQSGLLSDEVVAEANRILEDPKVKAAADLWEKVRAAKEERPDPRPIKVKTVQ